MFFSLKIIYVVGWGYDQENLYKRFFLAWFLVFLLTGIPGSASDGEEGVLGDESWTVEEKVGKLFYTTHGTLVWGHEFGFYKDSSDCGSDMVWLSFSASDEKVRNFVGDIAIVLLDIDGKTVEIELVMRYVGVIGFTQVMYFSDWLAGELLIDALMKGHYVTVKILKPKGLEALLDIKEDKFSLEGFVASRKEAIAICRSCSPDKGQKENRLTLLAPDSTTVSDN